MKAIKWIIIVLYVGIPMLIVGGVLSELMKYAIKELGVLYLFCFLIAFVCTGIFYIKNAEKFSKWFDSKLK